MTAAPPPPASPEPGWPPPAPPRRSPLQERLARDTPLTRNLLFAFVTVHIALVLVSGGLVARAPRAGDALLAIQPTALDAFGAVTPAALSGQPWRLVTAAFLHGNLPHLALNGLTFWSLGTFAERLFGVRALAACLAAGAIAASAAAALVGQNAVGASGAIVAVAGLIAAALRGPAVIPEVARAIRMRIFFVVGMMLALGLAANEFFASQNLPIAISNIGHGAGFVAGLAFGMLIPPPTVVWPGARGAVGRFAELSLLGTAVILLGYGGVAIARDLSDRSGGSLRERIIAGEALEDAEVPEHALDLQVFRSWERLAGSRSGSMVVFGPGPGAPFLQIGSGDPVNGTLPRELAGPDVLGETLRAGIEGRGGRELLVAPFEWLEVDGRRTFRVELRYREHGFDIQEVWYVLKGRRGAYWLAFLGMNRDAEVYAKRILPTVELRERR